MIEKRILLLVAVTLVLLCGCGNNEDAISESQELDILVDKDGTETINKNSEEEISVKEYDHSLVCDKWADSGSFKMYTSDEDFCEFFYAYSVPQIIDDTNDAKEINYLIECLFENMHEITQKASKEGEITAEEFDNIGWFQTNYDCYWNGSIASIVIYSTGYYDSNTNYNVYNYDFATGKQLSNEELFAYKGISGEKFEENLRRAATYVIDQEMQMFFENEMPLTEDELWYTDVVDESVQHMYGDYLQARAKTIHMDNINEELPVYLDAQGELQAVTHIYNMGMYGEVTSIISPIEWVNNDVQVFSGDLLDVASKDDGIYLKIYRTDWSEAIHEDFPNFDYAKEYKIDGLYKNYTDAKISWVGNGNQPYILLLSDDGMISYVDVWEGIASGYFCAVEPLWGLMNLKSFSDESEYRIAAVNNDGKLIDVEDSLYMMVSCRYIDFEKNMMNLNNVTRYSAKVNHKEAGKYIEYQEMIGFTDDKYHMFVREICKSGDYDSSSQTGYITFNGMNEKGIVYYYYFVGEAGEERGAMALNVYSSWDDESSEFIDGAEATWLSGIDIFESLGYRVMLEGTVG